MHLDSVISVLALTFMGLAILTLIIRIISKRVTVVLALIWLFFYVVDPRLREQVLSTANPVIRGIAPLLLMLLALRMIIRGKLR